MTQSNHRSCDVDLTEGDDGELSVQIVASRYHLQWGSSSKSVLEHAAQLLAGPVDGWDQVELGAGFGAATVLLVVQGDAAQIRLVQLPATRQIPDLFEVSLLSEERADLLAELSDALSEL